MSKPLTGRDFAKVQWVSFFLPNEGWISPCQVSELKWLNSPHGVDHEIEVIAPDPWDDIFTVGVENCKPILRPMSDMTEEEKTHAWSLISNQSNSYSKINCSTSPLKC